MTWWDLFSAHTCPHCYLKIKQPAHGLRRSTCETCHSTLPDALALHLDRAMHSRWYVAWWRVAMRVLRREQAREALSVERKLPAAALPVVQIASEAPSQQQERGRAC